MEKAKLIAAIVVAVLALVVMVQNAESTTTNFLWMSFQMPRALLLLLTFALGGAAGWLLAWRRSHKHN